MSLVIVNGSPKQQNSTSHVLINYFKPLLAQDIEIHEVEVSDASRLDSFEEACKRAIAAEALIFFFPLYLDSIPGHLLGYLQEIIHRGGLKKGTSVFCVINNGFYEGDQTRIALSQMKLWCAQAHGEWGQGVGVGAGDMYHFLKRVALGRGPNENLGRAFDALAEAVNGALGFKITQAGYGVKAHSKVSDLQSSATMSNAGAVSRSTTMAGATSVINNVSAPDLYVSPNVPRFIWRSQLMALYFYPRACRNGLFIRDLFKQSPPEL